ncbi:MAG: hypothetical protein HY233_02405 [Acidobacteriales bacterium]|nr:hypothetical protein [Candidatus Koribacter versatilis]MBI3644807.1 hypothetical protein [Terriglobales bacterium]
MRMIIALFIALVTTPLLGQVPGTAFPSGSHVYVEPSVVVIRDTVAVQAGGTGGYNFSLTRGSRLIAELGVEGGANNRIDVWLLDQANYQRYQAGQQFSYFKGTSGPITHGAKYQFVVPTTNIYYLVLDNRRAWMLSRTVKLNVYAILPEPTPETKQLESVLETQYQGLKKVFIFPDFNISIRHCGFENAFSNPNITLCAELIENLANQQLPSATAFVFFHELGHSLLRGWGLPMWDNEDAADEFATVLMMMGHQEAGALQAAQWWAGRGSTQEALSKLTIDDRHTISPQRARNIIHWLNSKDELLSRWERVFIPNIQTAMLAQMLRDHDWDEALIRGELRKRGSDQQPGGLQPVNAREEPQQNAHLDTANQECKQTWLGSVCGGQTYREIKPGKVAIWNEGTCAASDDGRLGCIFGHAQSTADCDHTWVGAVCTGQDFLQVIAGEGPQTLRWHGNVCGLNGREVAACITKQGR